MMTDRLRRGYPLSRTTSISAFFTYFNGYAEVSILSSEPKAHKGSGIRPEYVSS